MKKIPSRVVAGALYDFMGFLTCKKGFNTYDILLAYQEWSDERV